MGVVKVLSRFWNGPLGLAVEGGNAEGREFLSLARCIALVSRHDPTCRFDFRILACDARTTGVPESIIEI